ncbi:hypothetical protein GMMP15_2050003 [Candidatus Magnetomoraceae bacterium gMMP-15]
MDQTKYNSFLDLAFEYKKAYDLKEQEEEAFLDEVSAIREMYLPMLTKFEENLKKKTAELETFLKENRDDENEKTFNAIHHIFQLRNSTKIGLAEGKSNKDAIAYFEDYPGFVRTIKKLNYTALADLDDDELQKGGLIRLGQEKLSIKDIA